MARTLTISCQQPGGGAFLVDHGRPGHRAQGVVSGGAADRSRMRYANQLLGRKADAICLELTLTGGHWALRGSGDFCLTGADMNWRLDGHPLRTGRVYSVDGAADLRGSFAHRGLRAYVAVRGQWGVPLTLGSAESGLPGTGAVVRGWSADVTADRRPGGWPPAPVAPLPTIRAGETRLLVTPGPEWELLPVATKHTLLSTGFTVGRDSNRQGIRLQHDGWRSTALPPQLSSPVLPGTVQLTPTGPVLLGVAGQTLGGYPRVLLLKDRNELDAAGQMGLGRPVRLVIA